MQIDKSDVALIDAIAEAVVKKIDERDKINLLAQAVMERMQEISQMPDEQCKTNVTSKCASTVPG